MDFENLYITWYSRVKKFAQEYVISVDVAEDIAQEVFIELYKRKEILNNHVNIIAYLFTSVKNKSIDYLRAKSREQEMVTKIQEDFDLTYQMKFDTLEAFNVEEFSEENLKVILKNALKSLPPRCREIFIKNRIEGKKQKEIAEEMNISVKTIESQMTIAYKKLRQELEKSLLLFFFLFY